MKNFQRTLILGCSLVALAGCGADEIVSPGTGGNITVNINNPPPSPTPTPTPTPTQSLVTAAAGCPSILSTGGLTDSGVERGTPTGDYRVCTLPAIVDASDTLPFIPGLVYRISGSVQVGTDQGFASTNTAVTLTVEPGVIFSAQGNSALIVNRGNRLISNGTAERPIIWTSRDNIIGVASDNSQQQWGGVVLLGRAPVSDCATGGVNTAANPNANPQCQQNLEGSAVTVPYGGNNPADSSGSFTFNQIRFSGFELAPGNELQSLTTGGAGSGTTIANVLSFNSSDDGVEFFGGGFNLRNLAVIGASDDSLDVDTGAIVNVDTFIAVQRASTGDSIIELDSNNGVGTPIDALPRTRLQVNNATMIERIAGSNAAMLRLRGGAAFGLTNTVMNRLDGTGTHCFRVDEQVTVDNLIGINSVVCDGGTTQQVRGVATAAAAITGGSNVDLNFTITLTDTVVNGAGENGVTAFDASTRSSFFPTRTFIGAAQNGAALDVFRGWTCNSSVFSFGGTGTACTSLPIYS